MIAPAKSMEQMKAIAFNAYVNSTLTAIFLLVVFSVLIYAVKVCLQARKQPGRTDRESPFQPIPASATSV